jgi:hypothetical protein
VPPFTALLEADERGLERAASNKLRSSEMIDTALAESARKAHPTWWKVIVGLFFVGAAIERSHTGGILPGYGPTILYALCGAGCLFSGISPIFRRDSK